MFHSPEIPNALKFLPAGEECYKRLLEHEKEIVQQLVELKQTQKSIFFHLANFPIINIFIYCDKFTADEKVIMEKIFSYILIVENLSINILIHDKFSDFSRFDTSIPKKLSDSIMYFDHKKLKTLPHNSFLEILSVYKEQHIQTNLNLWYQTLENELKQTDAILKNDKENIIDAKKIQNLIDKINFLYEQTDGKAWLDSMFVILYLIMLKTKQIQYGMDKINKCHWQRMLNKFVSVYDLVHLAFIYNEGIDSILSLLDTNKIVAVDAQGDTFLHVCVADDMNLFQKALKLTPNINLANQLGNTPLHQAAITNHVQLARFLLLKGANPNIENRKKQTFLTIDSACPGALDLYRLFAREGVALKHPVASLVQKGFTCGFYAAYCAAYYYFEMSSPLFKLPLILPKKDDSIFLSTESLRMFGKLNKWTMVGEIFSVEVLNKILQKLECTTSVFTINEETEFDTFISIIQNAIQNGSPVIIPFCADNGLPSKNPNTLNLHWGTIVGMRAQFILVAQQGSTEAMDAKELFEAFYNVPDKTVDLHFYKEGKGKDWQRFTTPQSFPDSFVHKMLPSTSLASFRHHLIVVDPPKLRHSNDEVNANATIHHKKSKFA